MNLTNKQKLEIMKGLKQITLEGTESAIFHFETCEIWCDFIAEWEEKEWTETLHDPYCEIHQSSKELTYLEITRFDIEGTDIRFYKEKHKEFEELLTKKLVDNYEDIYFKQKDRRRSDSYRLRSGHNHAL